MSSQEIEIIPPEGPPLDTYEQPALPATISQRASLAPHINAGTTTIEMERAVAEVQGKILVAQRCPRNKDYALDELIRSCQEHAFASEAFYSYSRGGEKVNDLSIRFAEEAARCWSNIDYGLRELSQRDGVSEMEAYAWDMQTNTVTKQQFTVRHIRDTKSGAKNLTSSRDIYENNANMGARRMRARILALLPKWFVAAGEAECRKTLSKGAKNRTLADRSRSMLSAFATYNVSAAQLETKIGKPLSGVTEDDLITLLGVFQAIKDGVSTVDEQFQSAATAGIAAAVAASGPKQAEATVVEKVVETPKADPPAPKQEAKKPAQTQTAAKPEAVSIF